MPDESKTSLPAIMCTTGWDESFLVGTTEELRSFANKILSEIDKPRKKRDLLGVEVSDIVDRFTEEWGDACLDGITVTNSSIDTKKLINALRIHNGEDPVAAEGWPVDCS